MFRTIINRIHYWITSKLNEKNYRADYIESARLDLIERAERYGFSADSQTVKLLLQDFDDMARRARTRADLSKLDNLSFELDPHLGRHVEAYAGHDGAIMVKTMASREGSELVGAIVKAFVGHRLIFVKKVEIGSHETKLIDSTDNIIVAFYGAGRKMHHQRTYRAFNAQQALKLVGINVSIEEIALPDLRHFYEPLVYELQPGGAWSTHELEAVRG